MTSVSARVGVQRRFGMDADYRRVRGLRVQRGLSTLFGLLVLGGCKAGQASPSR